MPAFLKLGLLLPAYLVALKSPRHSLLQNIFRQCERRYGFTITIFSHCSQGTGILFVLLLPPRILHPHFPEHVIYSLRVGMNRRPHTKLRRCRSLIKYLSTRFAVPAAHWLRSSTGQDHSATA